MATYIMFGKYSAEGIKGISAGRTGQANDLIKKNGGSLKSAYACLGGTDLVFIVDLPDTQKALATSAGLSKLTGIAFTTAPAVSIEGFDKLMG
jgi:uncharacterized protein with GYD domain